MPWDTPDPFSRDPIAQVGIELIGAAMRRRRERRGLSQRDLERHTDVDQSTISRFERGERCGLRFARFARIVAVLGGLDFEPSPPGTVPSPRPPSERAIRARIRAEEEAEYQAALAAARELDDEDTEDAEDANDEDQDGATPIDTLEVDTLGW